MVERLEPSLRCAHIAIEQHGVGVGCDAHAFVVAFGKAPILVEKEGFHSREFLLKHLHTLVGATIVSHYHVGDVGIGVGYHRGQIFAQKCGSIPIEDNYGYGFHWGSLFGLRLKIFGILHGSLPAVVGPHPQCRVAMDK